MRLKKIPVKLSNYRYVQPFLQRLSEGVIPVFMLHRMEERVGGVSAILVDSFLSQVKESGYEFISLEELIRLIEEPGLPIKNKVMFTMDDGYLDQVSIGVPVFQKHNCPVAIGIITNFISGSMWPWDAKIRYLFDSTKINKFTFGMPNGQPVDYDIGDEQVKRKVMRSVRDTLKKYSALSLPAVIDKLSVNLDVNLPEQPPELYQPFGWGDVKRLEGDGVNFIAHTQNHYILSNLSNKESCAEIVGSISDVNRHIKSVPAFIYPNGQQDDFNEVHIKALKSNGIKLAFSTNSAYLSLNELDRSGDGRYEIPRMDFPAREEDQQSILSTFDFVSDRVKAGKFFETVENVYGIKRTVATTFIEYISQNTNFYKKNIDMQRVKRLVFICVGNICRSPFAETIALSEACDLPIISMGLEANGMDVPAPVAQKIAREFGYNMEYLCSTKIDSGKLSKDDLLVAMEISHLKRLKKVINEVGCQATLLGVWSEPPILSISDPYGRSEARFRGVFSHIKQSVLGLLSALSRVSS